MMIPIFPKGIFLQLRWAANRTDIEPEVHIEVRQGEVRQSLWEAIQTAAIAPLMRRIGDPPAHIHRLRLQAKTAINPFPEPA
jgi:hypothetical protein